MLQKGFLTPAEAAQEYGIAKRHIHTALASGDLRVSRIGRAMLIKKEDLEDWIGRASIPKGGEDEPETE
jgi:excisionase family DNA binding protein